MQAINNNNNNRDFSGSASLTNIRCNKERMSGTILLILSDAHFYDYCFAVCFMEAK